MKEKLTSTETHIPKVLPEAFVCPATTLKYDIGKHLVRYHREEILCGQLSRIGQCLRVLEGFCLILATNMLFLLVDQLEEVLRVANHFTYHQEIRLLDLQVALSIAVTPIVAAPPRGLKLL